MKFGNVYVKNVLGNFIQVFNINCLVDFIIIFIKFIYTGFIYKLNNE
jgi:hypothetical protein